MATPGDTIVTGKARAHFSITVHDGDAHGVAHGLKVFLRNHENSAVCGDAEASRTIIHLYTVVPFTWYEMYLNPGSKAITTKVRVRSLPEQQGAGNVYDISELSVQRDTPMKKFLVDSIPALRNSLESSAIRAISNHIAKKQASDFEFWRGSTGLTLSVSLFSERTIRLKVHRTQRTSPVEIILAVTSKGAKDFDKLTVSDLGIRSCRVFLPEWLQQYFCAHQDLRLTKADWKGDWWWNASDRPFRFLELPPELRITIYEHTVGDYIWPRFPTADRKRLCAFRTDSDQQKVQELWYEPISYDPLGLSAPFETALPLVSKKVREEYLKVLWEHTSKHFHRCSNFIDAIYPLKTNRFECLRSISLGLPNDDYYYLLGLDTWDHSLTVGSSPPIRVLSSIKTLKYLNLHFQLQPPYSQISSNALARWNHDGLFYPQNDPWFYSSSQVSCQKTMVDWILTFAFEHIRHVPQITLSGHVKNSTRQEWESIFTDLRKGKNHNISARKRSILAVPCPRQAHVCTCMRPCNWWLEHGPYPEALDFRNNRGPCPFYCGVPEPGEPMYDPRVHDLFMCED